MNKISRDLELEKKIDAYIKGNLNEEQSLQLWEELLRSPEYIELLETELGIRSIIQEDGTAYRPKKKGIAGYLGDYWKWTAAAASLLLLVVSLSYLQSNSVTLEESLPDDIDLSQNLITSEVIRSQETQTQQPVDSLLNHGFSVAMDGDIEGAIAIYEEIINEYSDDPTVVEAYLNKGIIHYNLDDFEKAITSFEKVLEKEQDERAFIREKAYWFLANGHAHLEHFREAKTAMENVYQMDGLYRDPASRMITRLEEKIQAQE